jgi:hypothetical protein
VSFCASGLRFRDFGVLARGGSCGLVADDPVEDPVEGSATTPKP